MNKRHRIIELISRFEFESKPLIVLVIVFTLFHETFGQFSWRRWAAEAGQGPTRDESFGTDFTNKCRRLNAGMSQDGSLSLNHRLPAAFLPPRLLRPTSFRRPQTRPLPLPTARPSFSCSTSLPRRLSTSETSGREEKEKGPHSKAASAGNLPHAYVAACLSFLSSRLERSLRQRQQPNPPRYSPAYRGGSDAISMTGDVQALIRGDEVERNKLNSACKARQSSMNIFFSFP